MINPTEIYERKYYKDKDAFLSCFRKLKNNFSNMNENEINVLLEELIDKFYDVTTTGSVYFVMKGIDYTYDHDKKED